MRLSLRTLLAFEDNVFDVEQHRRLESILPTDKNAKATLQRIRSLMRNPSIGVPGLVDHQEELDPNYVAEYLDHQMPESVQEKFENYCLSADKYLAEVASAHHILSNVLGEPARTSRECRLQCYNVLKTHNRVNAAAFSPLEQLKHFAPDTLQESVPVKPATFWQRWFSVKPAPTPAQALKVQKQTTLWTLCIIGMCIGALLYGWQQIEKQQTAQQLREIETVETFFADGLDVHNVHSHKDENLNNGLYSWLPPVHKEDNTIPQEPAPIEQAVYTTDASMPPVSATPIPIDDPFATTDSAPKEEPAGVELVREPFTTEPLRDIDAVEIVETDAPPAHLEVSNSEESIIAFQPIGSLSKIQPDRTFRQNSRPPLPATVWQSSHTLVHETPVIPVVPAAVPVSAESILGSSVQHLPQQPPPQPITQTSGAVPKILGRALPMPQPSLIFSAPSARNYWQLPALPFDLHGNQYLLSATPFRGTLELAASFQIEMIGDSKLCVLPSDASGIPGIFVDYGRIMIRPLKANQPLKIETEKTSGIVSVTGTESILYIDTFAEIADPPSAERLSEEQKQKGIILGFVPKNNEQLVWKLNTQPQPFCINTRGSVVLLPTQYRFGDVRNLPQWLEPMPMSQEEQMMAEVCRRYFVEAHGDEEKALTWLIQDESRSVRTLGFRLWGDLGRFDVPIAVMEKKPAEDEAVRLVLTRYFDEVMLRDAETIQRFADALEMFKSAQK